MNRPDNADPNFVDAPPVVGQFLSASDAKATDEPSVEETTWMRWRAPVLFSACLVAVCFFVQLSLLVNQRAARQTEPELVVHAAAAGPVLADASVAEVDQTQRLNRSETESESTISAEPKASTSQAIAPAAQPSTLPVVDSSTLPVEDAVLAASRTNPIPATVTADESKSHQTTSEPDEPALPTEAIVNREEDLVSTQPERPLKALPELADKILAPPIAGEQRQCGPMRSLGTTLQWAESPADAYQMAAAQGKMVFLIHVSGNFEIPGFT